MNPETLNEIADRIEAGKTVRDVARMDPLIVDVLDASGDSYVTTDETEAFEFLKLNLPAWRLEFLQERRLSVGSQWSVSLVFQDVQVVARSINPAAALTAACLRALAMEAGDE